MSCRDEGILKGFEGIRKPQMTQIGGILPLAVAFARAGVRVTGIDIDQRKIDAINHGHSSIEDIPSDILAHYTVATAAHAPAPSTICAIDRRIDQDRLPRPGAVGCQGHFGDKRDRTIHTLRVQGRTKVMSRRVSRDDPMMSRTMSRDHEFHELHEWHEFAQFVKRVPFVVAELYARGDSG
ncbi:MAG: hypothetical protein AMXMBFR16_11750 [Candidatus Uhrbacteria bacterium]